MVAVQKNAEEYSEGVKYQMGKRGVPDCKKCRREGERLLLKGERCNGPKCAMIKRPFPPGMHGKTMKKPTDYGIRLREKQRVCRFYGVSDRQLRLYFNKAAEAYGVTGLVFLQSLETRLDNIIYRLGLAPSRKDARQKVKHGHFLVNGKKVTIPSFNVKLNDKIKIKNSANKFFAVVLEKNKEKTFPAWINFNPTVQEGVLTSLPAREDIDVPVSEQLIVEYYSKS